MAASFRALLPPSPDHLARLSALTPANVYATERYALARSRLGGRVVLLGIFDAGRLIEGCLGILGGGAMRRRLEITSCPFLQMPDMFWEGVLAFCKSRVVWYLDVQSFGAEAMTLLSGPRETLRRRRSEFVIDLQRANYPSQFASNHKRNLGKAVKAGITVRRSSLEDDAGSHAALMRASMDRRADRGEDVHADVDERFIRAAVGTGAAELFQAVRDSEVLSSILIMRAPQGAYYHSAGTLPAGMECGASTFLVAQTAAILSSEGVRRFSLGGASEGGTGLRRFKAGFGATEIPLEAAEFAVMPPAIRKLRAALKVAIRQPASLPGAIVNVERYAVYTLGLNDGRAEPEASESELRLAKLSNEALAQLAEGSTLLADQVRRRQNLPFNDAFAVYCGESIAHIAWLIGADHQRLVRNANVTLRDGEAEIRHCFTSPEFRGRGVYVFAIRQLCAVARRQGISRVFMITNVSNTASRNGIQRAGLRPCGSIVRISLPWLSARSTVAFRAYRRA